MRKFWKNYTLSVSRMRKSWGFGVHSPFAFRLITKVIREKARYYAYDEIAAVEAQYITPVLTHKQRRLRKKTDPARGRLLFRLTNFFQPDEILEIGTAWGLSSLYLHRASRASCHIIVEPDGEINHFAQQLFNQIGESAWFIDRPYEECLPDCSPSHTPSYIVVNQLSAPVYSQLPRLLSTAIDNQSIIILDGIRNHNAAMECWSTLLKDPRVRVAFDLRNMGLICCNAKLNKQNYRIKL